MKNGKRGKQIRGFFEALKLLDDSTARYLIVGGVASSLHGLSRGTKDIDVLIPKDVENTKKILKALSRLTWGIAREITPEEVVSKPFTIIGDMPRVDLLLCAGKLKFEDAYKNKEIAKIEGIKIPFVSLADLIISKQTDRPNDILAIKEIKKLRKL